MKKWRERFCFGLIFLAALTGFIKDWRRTMEQKCEYCDNPRESDMECVFCGGESREFKWFKLGLMVAVMLTLLGIGTLFAYERGTMINGKGRMFCDSVETVEKFINHGYSLPNSAGIMYAIKSAQDKGINCWVGNKLVIYQEESGSFTTTYQHRVMKFTVSRFKELGGRPNVFSWEAVQIGESA